MKKSLGFIVLAIFFLVTSIPAYAQATAPAYTQDWELEFDVDVELNIRIEAIRDRRRAYTSLTDLHDLHILTPASAELQRAYQDLVSFRRQQSVDELFELEQITLSESERVLMRVEELGLFRTDEEELFIRTPVSHYETQINFILYGAILLTLCVAGFLLSNYFHKRRRKGRENVPYSDFAAARE